MEVPHIKGYSWTFLRGNLVNLMVLAGSVMFLMLPAYLVDHGLSKWEVGVCDGAFWFVSVFIQPWLGPSLDKHGRKPYLLAGSLLMGIMAACYVVVPVKLVPIFFCRALQGVGFTLYLTASWTWVADHAPPERMGEMLGVFGISGLIAGAGGPVAAEVISKQYDWQGLFVGAATLLIGAALLTLTLDDRPPPKPEKDEHLHFFALAVAVPMRGSSIGSIGFGFAIGCIFAFTAAYLQHLNLVGVSGMFAFTVLSSAVTRVWAGKKADELGPSNLIVPSLMLMGVGTAALGSLQLDFMLSHLTFLYGVLGLAGFSAGVGYAVVYPALNALCLERLPEHARGRGLSLVTASIDLGSTSGAALAGVLAQHFGYPWMFFFMGMLVMTTASLYQVVERAYRRLPVPAAEAA